MDNEVLKAIRERRSLRRFKGEQVGDDALKAVLEAGTWAPTAFGKQDPWIVAVQNEALRARLTAMNARVMGTESDPYYGAPTVVLVFASADSPNKDRDGSLVLGSMMVAAHSVGLASCWINREDAMFATEEGKALMRELRWRGCARPGLSRRRTEGCQAAQGGLLSHREIAHGEDLKKT